MTNELKVAARIDSTVYLLAVTVKCNACGKSNCCCESYVVKNLNGIACLGILDSLFKSCILNAGNLNKLLGLYYNLAEMLCNIRNRCICINCSVIDKLSIVVDFNRSTGCKYSLCGFGLQSPTW